MNVIELICHLLGDYCFQDHWMANLKTKSSAIAALHAFVYASVFFAVFVAFGDANWVSIVPIAVTHFLIDRYRLAALWVDWWGVGKPGFLAKLAGYDKEMPADAFGASVKFWLLIIVDNTMHLVINHASLALL